MIKQVLPKILDFCGHSLVWYSWDTRDTVTSLCPNPYISRYLVTFPTGRLELFNEVLANEDLVGIMGATSKPSLEFSSGIIQPLHLPASTAWEDGYSSWHNCMVEEVHLSCIGHCMGCKLYFLTLFKVKRLAVLGTRGRYLHSCFLFCPWSLRTSM